MLRWIVNFEVKSGSKLSMVGWFGHIAVAELDFSHGDVTNRPIVDNF
jgi:hypothetical protein